MTHRRILKYVNVEYEDKTIRMINAKQDDSEEDGTVMRTDSEVLMNIYKNATSLSDFIIKTESKQFPIHKEVLMARSPKYFKLFTEKDLQTNDVPNEVELKNISSEVIEELVMRYLYTGNIILTPDRISDLLLVANELELNALKDMCMNFLRSYTVDNVLELIPVCEKNLFKKLLIEMKNFVYKEFINIITRSSFAKLDATSVVKLLG